MAFREVQMIEVREVLPAWLPVAGYGRWPNRRVWTGRPPAGTSRRPRASAPLEYDPSALDAVPTRGSRRASAPASQCRDG